MQQLDPTAHEAGDDRAGAISRRIGGDDYLTMGGRIVGRREVLERPTNRLLSVVRRDDNSYWRPLDGVAMRIGESGTRGGGKTQHRRIDQIRIHELRDRRGDEYRSEHGHRDDPSAWRRTAAS